MPPDATPSQPAAVPPGDPAQLRTLYRLVRPHRIALAAVIALSLLATALALVQPYLTKVLLDDGLLAGRTDVVGRVCGVMVLAALAAAATGAANRWLYLKLSGRVLFALREQVYRHLLALSPAFYSRARGGDLLARLDGDIAEIQRFAVDSLIASVNGVFALLGTLAAMATLSWRLTLLALALVPAEVLFLRRMRPWVERSTRRVRERASDITAFLVETLGAVKFIQSVRAEDREVARLTALNRSYLGELVHQQLVGFATAAGPNLLTVIGTAAVFVAGGYLVAQHALTVGALIAFSAYLTRATGPVQTLLGLYVATQRTRVSLQRVVELTRVPPAVVSPRVARDLPDSGVGELQLDDVCFGYDRGSDVLHEVHVTIPAGAKVGVTGLSGAGKTTLIDLLHRHYDPHRGHIRLDGIDLRDLDLGELRRRIAVVAQDTVLFAGSLADNIKYAAPGATDSDVRAAAARAELDEFVSGLPDGYATEVGARGTALSGGQRQRVAIARALLQAPQILVLDEATSAVDRETARRIAATVDALFAERTRLVITHHADLLADADLVLRLVDRRLVVIDRPVLEGSG